MPHCPAVHTSSLFHPVLSFLLRQLPVLCEMGERLEGGAEREGRGVAQEDGLAKVKGVELGVYGCREVCELREGAAKGVEVWP